MELKQIKELMAAMEKAGIKKLSIKEKTGYELHLERQDEHHAIAPSAYPPPSSHASHPPATSFFTHPSHFPHHPPHSPTQAEEAPTIVKTEEKVEGKPIVSPMVGTFYFSPSPDDPAFVKVGDRVEENTVVCIIEAMKVMNEVKAGISGVVAEVCLDNGHPVEFGTKLFRIV